MEINFLLILCLAITVIYLMYNLFLKIKRNAVPETDDLILFILIEVNMIVDKVVDILEDKDDYEELKKIVLDKLLIAINESPLSPQMKAIATLENLSTIIEPVLKFLYEKKVKQGETSKAFLLQVPEEYHEDISEIEKEMKRLTIQIRE